MRKFRTIVICFLLVLLGKVAGAQLMFDSLKEINGTHLYVKVIGEGEPILVIHGGPGLNHFYLFEHLVPLADHYQLIFYDQRSAGASDMSVREHMTIEQFTEDIEAIRKEFKIEKLNILSHSWSSILTANYCIKYPEHVKSIIYSNPSPLSREFDITMNANVAAKTTSADSLHRAAIIASEGFRKGDINTVNELMRVNFKSVFCDTSNIDLFDAKLPSNYLVASLSLQGLMQDLKTLNLYDTLKAINLQVPVLILTGSCDIIPPAAFNKLAGCYSNAQLFTFTGSGHYPFIEENKLYLKTVKRFIRKQK